MNRFTRSIAPLLATLALGIAAGGCIVPPEDNQWEDVGKFAWSDHVGTTMRYKVVSRLSTEEDTTMTVIKPGKLERNGQQMFRIATLRADGTENGTNLQFHFLPTRDTLFTERGLGHENGLKATYALVSPLERGHTWIAAYADGTDSATVRATVIERFAYWKLEGKGYENVVAVKYQPVDASVREEWIRFYAKDVGVILTVKNEYPEKKHPAHTPTAEEADRSTLIETTVAP